MGESHERGDCVDIGLARSRPRAAYPEALWRAVLVAQCARPEAAMAQRDVGRCGHEERSMRLHNTYIT